MQMYQMSEKEASRALARFVVTFVALKVALYVSINLLARALREKS
jgi:hypothetical protein